MSQETPPPFGVPVPPVEPPAHFGPPPPPLPPPGRRRLGLRHPRIGVAVLAALVAAGGVGGFLISQAAASTSLASNTESGASPSPSPSGRPSHGRGGFGGFAGVNLLQDAATYLGVSEQTLQADLQGGKSLAQVAGTISSKSSSGLISALVGDETTAINSAESSGKISSTQASKLESNLTGQITSFVNRTGNQPSAGLPASGEQAAIAAAAKAIGVTASELESDLAGGQSIAGVAGAHSVGLSTVESAVTSAVDSQISSLESSGKLTSTEASQLTSEVPTRVDAWVNDTYPGWPFGPFGGPGGGFRGGPFGGFSPGGPWGQGPNTSPSASPSSS